MNLIQALGFLHAGLAVLAAALITIGRLRPRACSSCLVRSPGRKYRLTWADGTTAHSVCGSCAASLTAAGTP